MTTLALSVANSRGMEPLLSTEATIVEPRRRKRRKRRRRCKRHPKEGPHSPNCRGQKNAVCNNGSSNGQNLVGFQFVHIILNIINCLNFSHFLYLKIPQALHKHIFECYRNNIT